MYADCDPDAYADGVYNIPKVHPSYKADLDADLDGVACETPPSKDGMKDLSNYQPSPSTTTTTSTSTATPSDSTLPVTGADYSGTELGAVVGIGVGMALLGSTIAMAARRKFYRGAHR